MKLEKLKKIIPRRFFKLLQPAYHYMFSLAAALFSGFPSKRLIVIGVTGTAGKTSTSYLIAKMLTSAGYKTGFTSTTIFSDGDKEWLNDKKMTMPGRFFIQKILRRMVKNGCRYAVVETTSEGIKQFRHRFISYDILVFTGLYPEHIESHGSFEKYRAAKGELFFHLRRFKNKYVDENQRVCREKNGWKKLGLKRVQKTIIVNGDDEQADFFLNYWSEVKMVYSLQADYDGEVVKSRLSGEAEVKDFSTVKGSIVNTSADGIDLLLDGNECRLNLLGAFNAANALAAYAVGINRDLKPLEIITGLSQVRHLAGKMEMIEAGQNFIAMVDYSFEPKALEKLYETISLLSYRRLIHVLGSTGGGRDQARRPLLGRLAATKADIVIVTNEDPYDEDPAAIINSVAAGAEMSGMVNGENLFKILDREDGLRKAVELAKKNDMVLVTGKGAEQYICLAGGRKMAWDDRLKLRQIIVDKLCIDK